MIWLIVISFFFARGFVKTGLGDRIATYFVKWLGKSTLGLSYGLTLSEALIAPAMPSTTARAGGVFLPIIKSLSLSAGSRPGDSSSRKLGSYLVQSQFQVSHLDMYACGCGQFMQLLGCLWTLWSKLSFEGHSVLSYSIFSFFSRKLKTGIFFSFLHHPCWEILWHFSKWQQVPWLANSFWILYNSLLVTLALFSSPLLHKISCALN